MSFCCTRGEVQLEYFLLCLLCEVEGWRLALQVLGVEKIFSEEVRSIGARGVRIKGAIFVGIFDHFFYGIIMDAAGEEE